ncbi:MAG: 16S rRNA (cytosine(1402)-N(4))-methyltransferase RsmH [Bacilli bacterium]
MKHISVLKNESIAGLNIKENGIYVDATLGLAGHSSEILKRIKSGKLLAFDQDLYAIEESRKLLSSISENYEIIYSNFSNIKEELYKRNVKKVDGILFDIGVSSMQLDEDYRGFSYHKAAPLDMRMDTNNTIFAKTVVNEYSMQKLIEIFYKYGESKYAKSIARNIVEKRPINTTLELAEIIKASVPFKEKRHTHPARVIFQAIRIEVNNELEVFEKALKDSFDLVKVGGRICVITFHSLEDKICKYLFKNVTTLNEELQDVLDLPQKYKPDFKLISRKGIKPTKEELKFNNRSRSATLRIIERVK